MRKLIMRVFYINVAGLSKQRAKEQICELMYTFKLDDTNLPTDISEQYFFNDIWLPTVDGQTRVEVIFPKVSDDVIPHFADFITNIDGLDSLINKFTDIKSKLLRSTTRTSDISGYSGT